MFRKLRELRKLHNLLGCRSPKDAEKTKVNQEVRWEDEWTNTLDRGASNSNDAKIRVMNHKDYKTWKVGIGIIYPFRSITGLF